MEPKEQIRLKLDVADVIGEYIQLKPAGSGAFKGLCPFHAERTPSFHVSRERQIWKCFGCDKGGDIFAFVMDMEGLNFREALQFLAKKAGVDLPEYKTSHPASDQREAFKAAHQLATTYYTQCLLEYPNGQVVREYVAKRNLTPDLISKFKLGAAPADWDALSQYLLKQGVSESILTACGLAVRRKTGSGIIDRFRDRLMIPLADTNGTVVGFTARALPHASTDQAKYINSPETDIYHKGSMLYGLHLAKTAIRHSNEVIVVEGNLDVIASHKAGVENVVGSSGTALTESQLRILARYTKRLAFCLDDDAAGFAAAKRVVQLALQLKASDADLQFEVRCLVVPPGVGKDPDEIVNRAPEEWVKIARNSQPVIEYYFQKVIRHFEEQGGIGSIEARRHLIDELLPQVAQLTRPDEQHLYLLRIADATHVELDVLKAMLPGLSSANKSLTEKRVPSVANAVSTFATPEDQSMALLLGVALQSQEHLAGILAKIPQELFTDLWRLLYSSLNLVYTKGQTQPTAPPLSLFARLRAYLDEQGHSGAVQALDKLMLQSDEIFAGLTPVQVRDEVEKHLTLLVDVQQKKRRKFLESEIRQAELAGDQARLAKLLTEYTQLMAKAKTV